jgi:hypothetical protein
MKRTMFAMLTLVGLVFAGSALAAPRGAEPPTAQREDVQADEERGDVTPSHAPSTDIDFGECPAGTHRDGCTPEAPCVPDLETLREVHPQGDGDVVRSTIVFFPHCPNGTFPERCTDLDDDCVDGWHCILEEE